MKLYEIMLILEPSLEEEQVEKILSDIEQWVESEDGKIEKKELQGKRALAYSIKGYQDGIWVLLNLSLASKSVKVLEKKLHLLPSVVRFLLINL
ncbi:MAG: 30S ribosomal protein S6 [Chlamydiota bacterium]|nr:30S ribosomal protein S6 [Chlamydiota bacterium]